MISVSKILPISKEMTLNKEEDWKIDKKDENKIRDDTFQKMLDREMDLLEGIEEEEKEFE